MRSRSSPGWPRPSDPETPMEKRILARQDTRVDRLAETVVALGPAVYREYVGRRGRRQRAVLRSSADAVEIHWLDDDQLAAVIAAFPPGIAATVQDQPEPASRTARAGVDDPRLAEIAAILDVLVDAVDRVAAHLAPARPADIEPAILASEPPPTRGECRRIALDALERAGEAYAEGQLGRDGRPAADPSNPAAAAAIAAAALVDAGLHDGDALYSELEEALRAFLGPVGHFHPQSTTQKGNRP